MYQPVKLIAIIKKIMYQPAVCKQITGQYKGIRRLSILERRESKEILRKFIEF